MIKESSLGKALKWYDYGLTNLAWNLAKVGRYDEKKKSTLENWAF